MGSGYVAASSPSYQLCTVKLEMGICRQIASSKQAIAPRAPIGIVFLVTLMRIQLP